MNGLEKNIIACFITEKDTINCDHLQEDIMQAGLGIIVPEYSSYFPIYKVSEDIIPKLGRNKHFINLSVSEHPKQKDFAKLLTLVRNDYELGE